jgi:hypothetical protein
LKKRHGRKHRSPRPALTLTFRVERLAASLLMITVVLFARFVVAGFP